ncbi:MAG: 30S ribosomal protein S6 [Lachnospiraceae bacterium]|nr:30S ribosomal protein S6 [Lachnospiraceae bacterium]
MNKYELAVVLSAKVEEDVRSDTLTKCKAMIERYGGQVTDVDDWGKKQLAYEIDKMKEGYYTFIKFESEAEAPAQIESRMRIMDHVIRYLLVKDDGLTPKKEREDNEDE